MIEPIPFELPVNAGEVASLADTLLDQLERRALTDEVRNRCAHRLASVSHASFIIFPGSLQQDPIHPSVYYLAVRSAEAWGLTLLLRIALASSPSSGLFPRALLIGRMRTESGREIVVNATPFGPKDQENIRTFVEQVDRGFAPRPQGAMPAIEMAADPEAAFEGFQAVLKATGVNMASIAAPYEAGLWAAVVSGWREGYTMTTAVAAGQPIQPGFTKYNIEASSAAEFQEALRLVRGGLAGRQRYDVELSLTHPAAIGEFTALLEVLKREGTPAQFVSPQLNLVENELRSVLPELVDAARAFNVMLSIQATGAEPAEIVALIGEATGGRVNYKVSGAVAPAEMAQLARSLRP